MKDDRQWRLNNSDPGILEHAFDSVSDQHGASMDKGSFSNP
jgi:hypothetical protein